MRRATLTEIDFQSRPKITNALRIDQEVRLNDGLSIYVFSNVDRVIFPIFIKHISVLIKLNLYIMECRLQ